MNPAAVCRQYAVGCEVTPDPNGWADTLEDTYFGDRDVPPWLVELQKAGCTTPGILATRGSIGSALWVSTCPASVESLPVPQIPGIRQFSDIQIYCNACVPIARPGFVTIGWNATGKNPSGCDTGACVSAPPPEDN